MAAILHAERVSKTYRHIEVLFNITLDVNEQEILAVVGPQGAGKTTLIKVLSGLDQPNDGEIIFNTEKKPRIVSVFEHEAFFPGMTVFEHIEMMKRMYGTNMDTEQIIHTVGLNQWYRVKAKFLSPTLRKNMFLGMMLAADADLLLLDDFIDNMDYRYSYELFSLLRKIRSEFRKSILITGEKEDSFNDLADRVVRIGNGSVFAQTSTTTHEHTESFVPSYIYLSADPLGKAKEVLESMGIFSYQTKALTVLYIFERFDDVNLIRETLENNGITVTSCYLKR